MLLICVLAMVMEYIGTYNKGNAAEQRVILGASIGDVAGIFVGDGVGEA